MQLALMCAVGIGGLLLVGVLSSVFTSSSEGSAEENKSREVKNLQMKTATTMPLSPERTEPDVLGTIGTPEGRRSTRRRKPAQHFNPAE